MDSTSQHEIFEENDTGKRAKTSSITEYEKSLLLQLIEERKSVIEDKRTIMAVYLKKVNAWKEIEQLFNSDVQTLNRTEGQLKKIWENWKSATKKKVTQYKKAVKKTGGGPTPKPLPPDADRIAAMIPEQLKSLPNHFDSDATFELGDPNEATIQVEEFLDKRSAPTSREQTEKRGKSPQHRQESPDFEQTTSDASPYRAPKKKTRDPRSMLVEYENEEHKLRMKNLQLQAEIFIMELNIRKRSLEMLEEEHQKKMKILDAQLNE